MHVDDFENAGLSPTTTLSGLPLSLPVPLGPGGVPVPMQMIPVPVQGSPRIVIPTPLQFGAPLMSGTEVFQPALSPQTLFKPL